MSSLKHAIKRRVHLERAAPHGRKSLERKEEFLGRSKKWHERQRLIKILKEKARYANPEEFNFGMVRNKLENGKFVAKDEHKRRLLTQSQAGKLRSVLQREESRLEKIATREAEGLCAVDAAATVERSHVLLNCESSSDDELNDHHTAIDEPRLTASVIGVSGLKKGTRLRPEHIRGVQEAMKAAYTAAEELVQDISRAREQAVKVDTLSAKRKVCP
eukprot:Gregarina_sp_Poly_1__2245@NODE_15_length_23029_cov_81_474305_g13_i0_p15_GENE_NODE_15_length_23029_cov_81_474305_g13_i0NODE_15_length_23029_cov_81_474305_g13_i0_p15_ORF_typecomplete_len217_score28_41Utp11/PF03998_13/1_1e19RACo_C_ter/PF14574_6/0_12Orthopox_A5L/PF06193_11/0_42_NODE_15_length_23029_cov_81_474305_g13_i0953810188